MQPLARAVLDQVHADVAILGCNGVDVAGGVTNVNLPEAEVKQLMVAAAERVIVVADASKLGRVSLGTIAALDRVDLLVTSDGADPHWSPSCRPPVSRSSPPERHPSLEDERDLQGDLPCHDLALLHFDLLVLHPRA